MPSNKIIGGTPITDADPLQTSVSSGMTSQPANGQVTLVSGQSTQLIAAAAAGVTSRRVLIRCLASSWYVAEGEAASTSKFLVQAGEGFKSSSLLAINGWPVTGSPVAYVVAEAR